MTANMPLRFLGATGIKVSVLSYGNMVGRSEKETDEQIEIMKRAFELGINYFDTAERYGQGVAETIMGKAIKQFKCDRKDVVISTKLLSSGSGPNDFGMSRKHLLEGMNNSLKRLDLEYVDIIFSHRPDYDTPLEETCRAFNTIIEQGKAFYWGTSEWPVEMIVEALHICDKFGLHKPVVEQCQYNMLVRGRMEKEYEWIFQKYRYGTTIWSPLAGGILTGKYNSGITPPGTRYGNEEMPKSAYDAHFGETKKENTLKYTNAISDLAKEEGYSPAQLALAWAIANQDVSTCILGASKLSQLEDNIKALELYHKWNATIEEKCTKVLNNTPETSLDYRSWKPRAGRRSIALVNQAKKEHD